MKDFPLEMWFDEETVGEFAIPSWHINAHVVLILGKAIGMVLVALVVKK